MSPYSIWVSDDSLVVQDIVAPVVVREEDWMEDMVGGVVSVEAIALLAIQEAVVPPFEPVQLQVDDDPCAGFDGDEGFTVPTVQYAPAGYDSSAV